VDGNVERLLPELNKTVRTARLQMLATAPAHEVTIPCPVSTRYGFDYFQQLPDGSVVLGGGRDRAMGEEWTASATPTAVIQDYLTSVLRDKLKVRAPVSHRWAALVSYNSSGLPVLGEIRPGVWAAGGYCGTGNLMGALAGRALARRAFGEQTEFYSLLTTPAGRN
jgi:glycine/D-amino acid oxidase-like deaminating enzyme